MLRAAVGKRAAIVASGNCGGPFYEKVRVKENLD